MPFLVQRLVAAVILGAVVGLLGACASRPASRPQAADAGFAAPAAPPAREAATLPDAVPLLADDSGPLPAARLQARSRWTAVRWSELPGFNEDSLFEAWNAWLKSCERPGPAVAPLCTQVRQLSIASPAEQRRWMMARLQPYRVEPLGQGEGGTQGLLTGYYEPVIEASRQRQAGFGVPLYRLPAGLPARGGRPWFSRQEIETLPEARAALDGREIAWIADPVDALVLHIQGSGRLVVREPDGRQRTVRMAFAGTNDHAYKSVGRWLLDQGELRDASWPAIKQWTLQNPDRVQALLWRNPRYVFFKEETLPDVDVGIGPRGAQGVPLTAGRSIAVDPLSIPYGSPVWLASSGPTVNLQKLVFAQDTGSAIVGAVRADYFAGAGPAAGELAGRLKQPLRLWVLWPK
jgi:membrane-bound lytic murein transglycosylase A